MDRAMVGASPAPRSVATLRIAPPVIDAMLSHARRELPNECCGLLIGRGDAIDECMPTRNAHASPTRFLIDPAEHFAVIRALRGTPREIVGAYHSHPASPAVPSGTDVAEACAAAFHYVIISLQDAANPDVRVYRIDGGEFEELPWTRMTPQRSE